MSAETQVVSVPDGQIRDYVDGEFRKDTPYVRQTIEKRLINEHKYKREQIKIEFGLKLGSRRPRAGTYNLEQEALRVLDENLGALIKTKKHSHSSDNSLKHIST